MCKSNHSSIMDDNDIRIDPSKCHCNPQAAMVDIDLAANASVGTPSRAVPISAFQYMDVEGYAAFDDDASIYSSKLSACGAPVFQFGTWYANQMEMHPLRTKSITTGILAVIGDMIAQLIEKHTGLRPEVIREFDKLRILAMAIEGTFFTGPMLHYAFEFYEYFFPISCLEDCVDQPVDVEITDEYLDASTQAEYISKRKYINAFLHVAFDQIIMAFFYVGSMLVVTCIVEGHGSELGYELKHDYLPAVRASWMASLGLAPFQVLAFRFLPVSWRALAVNFQDVIWVVVMSYVTHRNRD